MSERETAGEEIDREEAQSLLEEAREAQSAFWSALGRLETCLGVDVTASQDLEETTINELLEVDE
jgi:hypothetical protein